MVQSLAFNYNGNLLVTPSKDKKIYVFDVRSGKIVFENVNHEGTKSQRAVWLGDTNRIATTGCGKERNLFFFSNYFFCKQFQQVVGPPALRP